jgi:hypothetical protein
MERFENMQLGWKRSVLKGVVVKEISTSITLPEDSRKNALKASQRQQDLTTRG